MKESGAFYDSETQAAIGVFSGFLNPDKFKAIGDELHEVRQKNFSSKQLNNISDMKVITQDVQQWINDVWFPKAKLTGLKTLAFVIPSDIFGNMSMKAANSDGQATNGIKIQYFDNEAKAKAWLRSN